MVHFVAQLVEAVVTKSITNLISFHHMHCSLGRHSPEERANKTISQTVYEVAMEAGYAGASCSDTYSSCPYTSHQMMAVARVVLQ
ncbi:hypothetical protein Pcinc_013409 [Petrolisthes cinctipes]|uniref:Uncharacterized protein n=1 Tax=Petrolisthes cinctipes TaxID=88211 RepID=A0AAE1KUC3_PETCI|nr:hypothetical protein Pcinc_013409 [Petrolisthes cinctipes]